VIPANAQHTAQRLALFPIVYFLKIMPSAVSHSPLAIARGFFIPSDHAFLVLAWR
jgi:hypothetical protein